MSGGAFEYKQFQVEEIARSIEDVVIKNNLPIVLSSQEKYFVIQCKIA